MAQDPLINVQNVKSLDLLITLEGNLKRNDAISPEIATAIDTRYADFGRDMIADKTGLDLSDLSPAETRIVNAIGRYVALQKRDGKGAARTFQLIRNRGLIDAAEATVAKSKVTQGFEVLDQADMRALSFEQIIEDCPEEFSERALWYARRTLGLPNALEKPPADIGTLTQQRTERLLRWLSHRAAERGGTLGGYTNIDVGKILGFDDLSRHGRVLGNIQSRIDFACYREALPPLGLCVVEHFANAWSQEDRNWAFPVARMKEAAQTYRWNESDFDNIKATTRTLPGQAAIPWRKELVEREQSIRNWAESLKPSETLTDERDSYEAQPEALDVINQERAALTRPEVRTRVSKQIERGPIGNRLKKLNGYRCQLCEALGHDPIGFVKTGGEPYVEAHHVTPVSELELGSLGAGNIMIVCANHHRQMHYGNVEVTRNDLEFLVRIDGAELKIKRFALC
ncbi:hypothetical protein [Qipengyuania aquimaris]|uniref:HNH endonuclease n=1 Tax=Qipengyuania aquimaris TaxID=255984 RepID=UPI001CD2D104|nr:hypothetical protein [Qipengyuania aquimaris]MCA0902961.1 hypothetical protein [Qipengyuania aquimaris]